jgi:Tfp pilus assembly protein PilV
MISIILSIGAINAFIPLIIILILIVAAAGLMRGYNIFALFGIGVLLGGAGKATLAGKNAAIKTEGVRAGLITRKKAQALKAYTQKRAIPKVETFAKYYGQEYSAAIASGASKASAAKIAYSNARIRMMQDKINTFQSSLNKRITVYNEKTNKKVDVSLIGFLSILRASSALKNDTNAQNLYNSMNSELNKLSSLAGQAKQIQLNRTSAAAAKADLARMRQLLEDYRETSHNLIHDLNKYELKYHTNRGKESLSYYYLRPVVNLVMPNKRSATNKPSFLNRNTEPQAHLGLHSLSSDLEKSFKEAFKP